VIDFTRGNEILSVKTTSTADSVDRLLKHLEELRLFEPPGATVQSRRLDLRISSELSKSDFQRVVDEAGELGIAVTISTFP